MQKGRTVSSEFDEKYAGKEFKIKKNCSRRLQVDEQNTVTLGQGGSILHVKDTLKGRETTATTTTTTEKAYRRNYSYNS